MKKLVLFFAAAIIAVSFASCGNASKKAADNDTTAVEPTEVTAPADTNVVDTPVDAPAETPAK